MPLKEGFVYRYECTECGGDGWVLMTDPHTSEFDESYVGGQDIKCDSCRGTGFKEELRRIPVYNPFAPLE